MSSDWLVLRAALEPKRAYSAAGPKFTIGRSQKSTLILTHPSTSSAHAEITLGQGEAVLCDVGSDAGTFYRQECDEDLRRLGVGDSVRLEEGDLVRFGTEGSELYTVERAARKCTEEATATHPQLEGETPASNTDFRNDSGGEDVGDDAPQGSRGTQLDGIQTKADAAVGGDGGNAEWVQLVITIARAEGLPGPASKSIFKTLQKNTKQRRHVRVSISGIGEGGEVLASAVTSSIPGCEPECRWEGAKGVGEELLLRVDRARAHDAVLELQLVQCASGGDEILLGRGQTPVANAEIARPGESRPRWVMLSLDGIAKGKIEIMVSESTITAELVGGASHDEPRVNDGDIPVEQDVQMVSPTDLDQITEAESGDEEEGTVDSHHIQGDEIVASKESQDAQNTSPRKPRSLKWGLPRMPDLKNTLNATITRATNLRSKQKENPDKNETSLESQEVVSHEESGQPMAEDESKLKVVSEKESPGKAWYGNHMLLGARHGAQSLKESLEAKLAGGSGKFPVEREESEQHEGEQEPELREEGQFYEEDGLGSPRAGRNSVSSSSSNVQPTEHGAHDLAVVASRGREAVDDQSGASAHAVIGHAQGDILENVNQHSQTSLDLSRKNSSTEGNERSERRASTRRVDGSSPLRTLLREDGGGRDSGKSKKDEPADDKDERGDSGDEQVSDIDDKGDTASPEHEDESIAQNSVPAVNAASLKAAAARLKTTLSSPILAASLKGFGWNRRREEGAADGRSSSVASAGNPEYAAVASALPTPLSEERGELAGNSDSGSAASLPEETTSLLITIFRASDLPENLAKGKFGRTKPNATQDPYVVASSCGVAVATSAVQGGGRECRWGKKKAGESVEMRIPTSTLVSSTLVVELWNKASEEREVDILLGSTELPLVDWLGKKAAWANLELKKNRRGRVKLSIGTVEPQDEGGATASEESRQEPPHAATRVGGDTSDSKIVAETDCVDADSDTADTPSGDLDNAGPSSGNEVAPKNAGEESGMATITEYNPTSRTPFELQASAASTRRTNEDCSDSDSSHESKVEVSPPPLAVGSISSESPPQRALNEQGEHTRMQIFTGTTAADPVALKQVSASDEGTESRRGTNLCANPTATACEVDIVPLEVDTAEVVGVGSVAQVSEPVPHSTTADNLSITVLVKKADSLAMATSKTAFGRPKPNVKQDPYVVLSVCKTKQATSTVIGGGSKCQWSGKAGEAVDLEVSYADLVAAGWGQATEDGPQLTVEVWNQECPSRLGDTFISSATVSLKKFLGSGAKWVKLSRGRKARGRVKIDVKCQVHQHSSPDCKEENVLETEDERSIHEEGMPAVDVGHVTRSIPLGPSKPTPNQGDKSYSIHTEEAEQTGDGNHPYIPGNTTTEEAYVSTQNQSVLDENIPCTTSTRGSVAGAGETGQQGFDTAAVSQHMDGQSSPPDNQPSDSRQKLSSLARDVINSGGTNEPATDDEDEHISTTHGNLHTSQGVSRAAVTGAVDELHRRPEGGTSTALELPTIAAITSNTVLTDDSARSTADSSPRPRGASGSAHVPESLPSGLRSDPSPVPTISGHHKHDGKLLQGENDGHTDNGTTRPSPKNEELDGDRNPPRATNCTPPRSFRPQLPEGLNEQHHLAANAKGAMSRANVASIAGVRTAKRLARAREIVRRRKEGDGVLIHPGGSHRSTSTPSSFQTVSVRVALAAATIQGAFRGWRTRRNLRLGQRGVIKIQAMYRRHREQNKFQGLRARTRRAKVEEQRAQSRRLRISSMQKELDLLRSTPARQLLRIDALRATAMASRIQRCWRRHGDGIRCHGTRHEIATRETPLSYGGGGTATAPMKGVEMSAITAPEIKWCRSDRAPASGMTLEALRLRVATRQRARERSHEAGEGRPLSSHGVRHVLKRSAAQGAVRKTDGKYESLLVWQQNASRLTAALHRSETERLTAAKRRVQRLTNFRTLQDQLLHLPKLSTLDKNTSSTDHSGGARGDDEQRRRVEPNNELGDDWSVTLKPAQCSRAERAHNLAAGAARAKGNKGWTVSLPADVGYDEPVDVRRVRSHWPTKSVNRERPPDRASGFVHERDGRASESKTTDDGLEFDDDEASLWWYSYACTGKGNMAGLVKEDIIFAELLERVKVAPAQRRERAYKQRQERQLRIVRESQKIFDNMIYQRQAASCPSLSCLRGRVTAAQRKASIVIQTRFRGFLQRKKTAVLRAEMRVFGAFQVLINELHQPELEKPSPKDPIHSFSAILADCRGKTKVSARSAVSAAPATRRASQFAPDTLLQPFFRSAPARPENGSAAALDNMTTPAFTDDGGDVVSSDMQRLGLPSPTNHSTPPNTSGAYVFHEEGGGRDEFEDSCSRDTPSANGDQDRQENVFSCREVD